MKTILNTFRFLENSANLFFSFIEAKFSSIAFVTVANFNDEKRKKKELKIRKSKCIEYIITHKLILIALIVLTACNTGIEKNETIFYIDNQEDFAKYSGTEFPEGSKVLFATGTEFEGQFVLKGSGSENNPNIVSSYDPETKEVFSGSTKNKSVINGLGKVEAPIYLYNGQHWEINNIEVTNTDGTFDDQGKLKGIYVVAENSGILNNISIKNCYIHKVNGHIGGKETGGIHINVLGDSIKTKFHNLLIENNIVSHCGGVGISNQSSWGNINTPDYFPWTNFKIRKNRIEQTGRNGIIVRYAESPMVEYNVLAFNSRFDSGHSVFNFNTVNCIVQYNEAYGNTSTNVDEIDHGGFDADYNSRGTVIQYNYSHDNNWFCGIMRKPYNTDITIRYNISQNELLGAYLYGFPWLEGVSDVKIYNNSHYFGKGKGKQVFVAAGKERIPTETVFRNNIFYFEEPAEWGFEPDETCLLENNLFYNLTPKGKNAIVSDPLFVAPGMGGTDIDMADPDRLQGYKLVENSPAINTGININKNGGKDFAGNSLKETSNIGAF